jgi:uncharacterized protein
VKVLEVDQQRKRIALTMRLDESAQRVRDNASGDMRRDRDSRPPQKQARREPESVGAGAMADAFARALKRP